MWISSLALLVAAAPPATDLAVRLGSVGFDSARSATWMHDGDLLLAGGHGEEMDAGGLSLPGAGGYIARLGSDGRARFLVAPASMTYVGGAAELDDDRVIVIGTIPSPREYEDDGVIAFLDGQGREQGSVRFGITGDVRLERVVGTRGGGAVVVGSLNGRIDTAGQATRAVVGDNDGDGMVLAVDRAGVIRWAAKVGGRDGYDSADRVVVLKDGSVLVAGVVRGNVDFVDGTGARSSVRCGDPVQCPFLWSLDAETGGTRFKNVLKNGSGLPDVATVLPLDDGGFVAGGSMGRNLKVGSALERKKRDEKRLTAADPVSSSWIARFDAAGGLVWARRADRKGSWLVAITRRGDELVLAGTGDLGGAPDGDTPPPTGEGPATLARVKLADGALVDAVAFGRPDDAPLTKDDTNLRIEHALVNGDGRIVLVGAVYERAWLTLAQGSVELTSRGRGHPGYANEHDVFIVVVGDVSRLAVPAVPAGTQSTVDALEGCVARREAGLIVPCEPVMTTEPRSIHGCTTGVATKKARRKWVCGPLGDDVPLLLGERELTFQEHTREGRFVLYREMVGVGACGGLKREACNMTARLIDENGAAGWTRPLDHSLSGVSDTEISDVLLLDGTLYVVEACWGYELGHRGRCDQVISLDPVSGKVKWRSAALAAGSSLLVMRDVFVGLSRGTHGTSKSRRTAGRITAIDRTTGSIVGEHALPEDAILVSLEAVDGDHVRLLRGAAGGGPAPAPVVLRVERKKGRVVFVDEK